MRGLVVAAALAAGCGGGTRAAPSTPGGAPAARAPTAEQARIAEVDALWFADEPDTGAEVARRYAGASPALRVAIVRALGRLGGPAEQPLLAEALGDADAGVRRAAGIAAGIHARRKLEIAPALLEAAAANAGDADRGARYGAAYALAHPIVGPGSETLVKLATDPDAEIRALALAGLARRKWMDPDVFARGLSDENVWVQVEAARALSSPDASPEMRAVLAGKLFAGRDGHVLREGLARLLPHAREEAVGAAYGRWAAEKGAPGCLGKAGLVRRDAPLALLEECDHERHRYLAPAIVENLGTPEARIAAVAKMWAAPEARVRAAAAEAAVSQLAVPENAARAEAVVRAALAASEPAIAGSAADALAALGDKAPPWAGPLLVARAREVRGKDAELFQSFLDAAATLKLADAAPLAREALADGNAAVRAKARAVLKDLGQEAPPVAAATPSPPPPVDVRVVAGRKPVLTVETTRGAFHIELDPAAAPWNCANLVTLSEKKLYDGTLFHRVVPNFVVQGGDPTGTGWGGPGYTVPGEPSAKPYARGAVGIADAGKDTGGSQWFVTHTATPHLEGRYTLVGQVPEADMKVVDALQVGDRIVSVKVQR
jgi:cyclophilin family peptidyl-prolyl cis-trans isomerase